MHSKFKCCNVVVILIDEGPVESGWIMAPLWCARFRPLAEGAPSAPPGLPTFGPVRV